MTLLPSFTQNTQELAKFFKQDLPNISFKGFSCDTRTLIPGNVYCALKGKKIDGHQLLEEAYQKKAVCALVEDPYVKHPFFPLIYVSDVLKALQNLAKELLKYYKPQIVAISGSMGKTTTKDFIAHLLGSKIFLKSTPGNANSQVGIALALLNLSQGNEKLWVIEMGMTEKGQLKTLVEMAPPDIAVLTKVALVHAENFTCLKAIAEAKAELFGHPKLKTAIYDKAIEDLLPLHFLNKEKKQSFSLERKADLFLKVEEEKIKITYLEKSFFLKKPPLLGQHNFHNLAAALSVAFHFKLTLKEIEEKILSLKLPKMRLEQKKRQGIFFLDDSYNGSGMSEAFNLVDKLPTKGKKIGVIGSVLELGTFSTKFHQNLGIQAAKIFDAIFCLGKECEAMVNEWEKRDKKAFLFEDHLSLITKLKEFVKKDDLILIKGSFSKQLWQIMEAF